MVDDMSVFAHRVSWIDNGQRVFGEFLRWDGTYAVVRRGTQRSRVYKGNLTFEGQ